MVQVDLFRNADDKRVIDKTLTPLYSVNANIIIPSSVMTPQLRIAWSTALPTANYMYIAAFGRYYYITDITADTGGAAIITGRVDVLMSYDAAIKSLPAVVVRSTSSTNTGSQKSTWIPDPQLPMTTGRTIKAVILEGSDLNIDTATMLSTNFVLNVAGGGAISGGE